MLTKEAIDTLALSKAQTVERIQRELDIEHMIAVPNDFALLDTEAKAPTRRRARGTMTTATVSDFARYVDAHGLIGTTVFVDANSMRAVAVLNLGDAEAPGHADNTAVLQAETTAAHAALRKMLLAWVTQRDLAEFLEDWSRALECTGANDSAIEVKYAVDAIRRVTIEAARKTDTAEGKLSAERTAFESVKARSDAGELPTLLRFTCEPYKGLGMRTFDVRVGVRTSEAAPTFVLRLVKAEEHAEQMALQFAALISEAVDADMPVLLGEYSAKP